MTEQSPQVQSGIEIARQIGEIYARVRTILTDARAAATRTVNTEMVRAYWLIGREIVEEEQQGQARAGYGEELIAQLSAQLQAEFGRGFGPTTLRYMRLFYTAYPRLLGAEIHYTPCDESPGRVTPASPLPDDLPEHVGRLNPRLAWSHYRLLTRVASPYARAFYETETA